MSTALRITIPLGADQREQRLQQLRARQAAAAAAAAALEAEIFEAESGYSSSAPTPSSYQQQQQHRVQKHYRRNSNVPRSMSTSGPAMSRHLSSVGQIFSLSCSGSNDK